MTLTFSVLIKTKAAARVLWVEKQLTEAVIWLVHHTHYRCERHWDAEKTCHCTAHTAQLLLDRINAAEIVPVNVGTPSGPSIKPVGTPSAGNIDRLHGRILKVTWTATNLTEKNFDADLYDKLIRKLDMVASVVKLPYQLNGDDEMPNMSRDLMEDLAGTLEEYQTRINDYA